MSLKLPPKTKQKGSSKSTKNSEDDFEYIAPFSFRELGIGILIAIVGVVLSAHC